MSLRKDFQDYLNSQYSKPEYFRAGVTGNGQGIIEVAGQPSYVWVTVAGTENAIPVFNKIAPLYNGLPVLIGYTNEEPNLLQVISIQSAYPGTGANQGLGGVPHASTHRYMDIDAAWIEKMQLAPLKVIKLFDPSKQFAVTCYRDVVFIGGAWRHILPQENAVLNLQADVPVSGSQALYDLIYLGASGSVLKSTGSTKTYQTLSLGDIPAIPAGAYPLAAIRLYAGQTGIQENRQQTDIIDLRFSYFNYLATSASGSWGYAEPYITSGSSSNLTNYRVLTAGTNITLDTSTPGQIVINASGSGGGGTSGSASVQLPIARAWFGI